MKGIRRETEGCVYVQRWSGPGVQAASRAAAGFGGRPITVRLILK